TIQRQQSAANSMASIRPSLPSSPCAGCGMNANTTPITTASPNTTQTTFQNWMPRTPASRPNWGERTGGDDGLEEGPGDNEERISKVLPTALQSSAFWAPGSHSVRLWLEICHLL